MLLSRKIENIHLSWIKILLLFIPFLPLYVSTYVYFPYIAGKNFIFRIIVELAAVLWLVLIGFNKEYRPQNSRMVLSILAFTFIVGLADLMGVNPYKSFWSNYERMEGYITLLHLALYFIILKSIIRARKDWSVFLNLILIAGTFTGLYAIYPQASASIAPRYIIEYGTRISGTVGNPPFLASYLLLVVSIGLIILVRTQKTSLKVFYLCCILLNLAAIYLTASRGAILAFAIGIAVLFVFYLFKQSIKSSDMVLKKIVVFFLVLLVVSAVFIVLFRDADLIRENSVLSRFVSISSDGAVETRFKVWKMAWEGIKARPILGWGQENFLVLYTIVPIPFAATHAWVDRAHNILIHWLVNAGLLGLVSYLAVFGSAIFAVLGAVRKNVIHKDVAVVIITALIVYFVQNLFSFDTINTYIVFFSLLAYIDSIDCSDGTSHDTLSLIHGKQRGMVMYTGVIIFSLVGFAIIAYLVNYKPIRQSQMTKKISVIVPSHENYNNVLDDFKRALSYSTFGDTYVRLQMSSMANQINFGKLFQQEGTLMFIHSTAEELYRGISRNSGNLMYLSSVINFYQKIAVYEPSFVEKTEILINACISLNPEYQWPYMVLSDLYVQKKDYEGAYATLKRILAYDPKNDVLHIKLALAAILTERGKVTARAIENARNIRVSRNSGIMANKEQVFSLGELYFFAQAYKEVRNYDIVLKYYKEMLDIMPLNAKFHYEISEIYLHLGDKVNASLEAKRAAELAPGIY
jgi:O-antigen ligase/tetratricopeptide (TPR) repeat protein